MQDRYRPKDGRKPVVIKLGGKGPVKRGCAVEYLCTGCQKNLGATFRCMPNELLAEQNYCSRCGTPLDWDLPEQAPAADKKKEEDDET